MPRKGRVQMVGKFAARDIEERACELRRLERQLRREASGSVQARANRMGDEKAPPFQGPTR